MALPHKIINPKKTKRIITQITTRITTRIMGGLCRYLCVNTPFLKIELTHGYSVNLTIWPFGEVYFILNLLQNYMFYFPQLYLYPTLLEKIRRNFFCQKKPKTQNQPSLRPHIFSHNFKIKIFFYKKIIKNRIKKCPIYKNQSFNQLSLRRPKLPTVFFGFFGHLIFWLKIVPFLTPLFFLDTIVSIIFYFKNKLRLYPIILNFRRICL